MLTDTIHALQISDVLHIFIWKGLEKNEKKKSSIFPADPVHSRIDHGYADVCRFDCQCQCRKQRSDGQRHGQ